MFRVILYTLIVFAVYFGGKTGVNLLMAKFGVFSKIGALRFMINPAGMIRRGSSIVFKIIKNGAIVIAIMTAISLMMR